MNIKPLSQNVEQFSGGMLNNKVTPNVSYIDIVGLSAIAALTGMLGIFVFRAADAAWNLAKKKITYDSESTQVSQHCPKPVCCPQPPLNPNG